jgi:hypothetical protein
MTINATPEHWIALASEYSLLRYSIELLELADRAILTMQYADGCTPREAVDAHAERYSLDSYEDLNFGKSPPGADYTKYDRPPVPVIGSSYPPE